MPKSLHDEAARRELRERLDRLTPHSQGRWGRMNVGQMLCHLGDVYRGILADPSPDRPPFPGKPLLRKFPLKHLALYVFPFPKGVKGPARAFLTQPADFERDRAVVQSLTDDFGRARGRAYWPGHPYFGPLSESQWGVFTYKHHDHHLRQFGV